MFGRPNGKCEYMKKRIIAIILSIAITLCNLGLNYEKASATGLGATLTTTTTINPAVGLMLLLGIVGVGVAIEYGDDIKESVQNAGEQVLKDFESYSLQAIENNQNATNAEIAQNARIRETIDDFCESLSAGVIDVTSDAWDWFRDFVNEIYAYNNENMNSDGFPNGSIEGFPIAGPGHYQVSYQEMNGGITQYFEYMIESIEIGDCLYPVLANNNNQVAVIDYLSGKLVSCKAVVKYRFMDYKEDGSIYHEYSWSKAEEISGAIIGSIVLNNSLLKKWNAEEVNPDAISSLPVGTTDIPGVANPGAYAPHGEDCLVSGNTGAWDLCDPLGVTQPVELGPDVPCGYETWEEAIAAANTGEISWPQVIEGLDIVGVESNTTDIPSEVDRTKIEDLSVVIPGSVPVSYDEAIEDAWADTINSNIEEETSETEVKYEESVKPFILNFKDLFPFCIPFDIYHFFKILCADPVAPVIHYKFYVSKSKYHTININLNKFNEVAEILRKMELLAFIVGLAFVTRDKFIRG